MNLWQWRNEAIDAIVDYYGIDEAETIITWLIADKLNYSRIQQVINRDKEIELTDLNELESALKRLVKLEPIQHIVGYEWFMGEKFLVNKDVLIPRPETGDLIDWINTQNLPENAKVLDACTGCGCIATMLKLKNPGWSVSAFDISAEAVEMAKKNAQVLLQNQTINYFDADIFAVQNLPVNLDLIVSNPPYVALTEKPEIKPHVLSYEPHIALFAPENDALIFYRRLFEIAETNLKPGGLLAFETNTALTDDVLDLFKTDQWTDIELIYDQFGLKRHCAGRKR